MMTSLSLKIKELLSLSIVKEMSFYSASQVVVQAASFLGVILVGRYLGPTNLGLYSFSQDFILSFLTILIGINFYFSFEIAKEGNKIEKLKTFIFHKLYLTIFLLFLANLSAFIILPKDVALLVFTTSLPLFFQPLSAFSIYATSNKYAKLSSIVAAIGALVSLFLRGFLVYFEAPLFYFTFIAGLDLTLVSILSFFYFYKQKDFFKGYKTYSIPKLQDTFSFLYRVRFDIFYSISWLSLLRVDKLTLALLVPAKDLGIYSAALKIAEVPNVLAGVLYTALLSRIHTIQTKDDHRLKKSFYLYLVSSLGITFGVIIFAPIAVSILYGPEFSDSASVLRVYALTIVPMFLAYYYIGIYGAHKKSHIMTMVFSGTLLCNFIFVVIGTKLYGLIGAAAGTVLAYYIAIIFLALLKNKFLK